MATYIKVGLIPTKEQSVIFEMNDLYSNNITARKEISLRRDVVASTSIVKTTEGVEYIEMTLRNLITTYCFCVNPEHMPKGYWPISIVNDAKPTDLADLKIKLDQLLFD